MKPRMIALTGCIGSGKSTIAKILSHEYNFDVVDCDALARELAENSEVLSEISAMLGEECVSDGHLNRKKVREIVFGDTELYKKYNAIFFERIKALLQQRTAGLQTVFVEIPVLSAFSWNFDEIWLIDSEKDSCIVRASRRDGVSEENIDSILSRQEICQTYTRRICNYGSLSDLRAELDKALYSSGLI